jgi:putative hemolysin
MVDSLAEDPPSLFTAEQLALKLFGFTIVVLAVVIYADSLAQILAISNFVAVTVITIVAALIALLFGELIPREIGRSYAEPIALLSVYPLYGLSYLAVPLTRIVSKMGRILTGRWDETEESGLSTMTEEDLLSYVDVGEEEGVLKEEEREMIYSIFDLDDTLVREVMVPRIDIVAVEADASVVDAMNSIIQAGHSRAPVYVDTIDNVIGILYVKDLLVYWLENGGEPRPVRGLERKVYYVPETKSVSDMLRELQAKKVHIAIVVDEYGGTAGLVTIEDLLEEIVGEIQDEHDADEFYMQYISDDEYIFSARMDLDDINDLMEINLPTEDSDTLGGLIYDLLGRIPKTGDKLSGASFGAPNLHFTVLEVEGRRIKTAKIERVRERLGQPEEHSEENRTSKRPSSLVKNPGNTISQSS